MAATGVTVADNVATEFNDFKLHRNDRRYYIYKIDSDEIVIEASGDRDSSFEDMLEHLPPNEGRYALFDLDFNTKDGRPTSKLVFIAWAPDTAKIKTKMMYSGSKEALKSALVGVGIHVQANDQSDLDLEKAIIPAAQKFT